jgi:cystathionine gamma-synthase
MRAWRNRRDCAPGIGPGLLRVSVGIEDAADLVADLRAGLERAAKAQPAPHRRRHAS